MNKLEFKTIEEELQFQRVLTKLMASYALINASKSISSALGEDNLEQSVAIVDEIKTMLTSYGLEGIQPNELIKLALLG